MPLTDQQIATLRRLPEEIRSLQQFIPYCLEVNPEDGTRPAKVPKSPFTGLTAYPKSRQDCVDFETALACAYNTDANGIGLMLFEDDPYAILDIDLKHLEMDDPICTQSWELCKWLNCPTEVSVSGRGLHVFLKTNEVFNRRTKEIEFYTSKRFIALTGDMVIDVLLQSPEAIQEKLSAMKAYYFQVPGNSNNATVQVISEEVRYDDDEVLERCHRFNGEKFAAFFERDFDDLKVLYPQTWDGSGQSTYDQALFNMLSFHSRNKEQTIRLFHQSQLGQRPKAFREDYLDRTFSRAMDLVLPEVEPIPNPFLSDPAEPVVIETPAGNTLEWQPTWPEGKVGELAKAFYRNSKRPIPLISIVSALGLFSGVFGRSHSVWDTSLNIYMVLVAGPATGKEDTTKNVSNLLATLRQRDPKIANFLGPKAASYSGLMRHLAENPCCVSLFGEFGKQLGRMGGKNPSETYRGLAEAFLDLYGKGEKGNILIGQTYSDKEKNVAATIQPAFSMLCESAPGSFWKNLTDEACTDGFLPRFSIFEYTGLRSLANKEKYPIPCDLVDWFLNVGKTITLRNDEHKVTPVELDVDALALDEAFDRKTNDLINAANAAEDWVTASLWGRTQFKILKIASLIAVGVNVWQPVITASIWQWAHDLVIWETENVLSRFARKDVGADASEGKQIYELKKAILEALSVNAECITKSQKSHGLLKEVLTDSVVPLSYLYWRVANKICYKQASRDVKFALDNALKVLCDSSIIEELDAATLNKRYCKRKGRYFQVLNFDGLKA